MAFGPLVTAAELRRHAAGWTTVDCRFRLDDPNAGRVAFERGHIPGAQRADLASDMSGPPGAGGRHPLPAVAAFEAAAARLGIGASTVVVAYDSGEGGAARLWWLLRHFGHPRAAVLDGGLDAWRAAGGTLERGPGGPARKPPQRFVARPATGDTIAAGELSGAPAVVDARAPERYRGEVETLDPVAGHIPGARNLPFTAVAPGGKLLAAELLREKLAGAGVAPGAAVYCGSGVTAATLVLAAEVAGVDGVRLYPGSWSEWSRRGLPAER